MTVDVFGTPVPWIVLVVLVLIAFRVSRALAGLALLAGGAALALGQLGWIPSLPLPLPF